ncbi:hypothetical protein Fmac_002485 [Flemingia macrophylla]|uniref:Protein phosphatase n=1 Tax=Flemingia macrophylla TaxID=520843 RepID=A0ABD1NMW5_9FABA
MERALGFVGRMEEYGLRASVQTYNVLIWYFCDVGEIERGLEVFEKIGGGECLPNLDTYNVLICAMFVRKKSKDLVVAGKLLMEMVDRGFTPTKFTFNSVLNGLVLTENQEFAKEILRKQSECSREETGGEDAHFICTDEQAIGVVDGVGGWADVGVDSGLFSRELISNSVRAIQEEPKGSFNPTRVLEKAHLNTKAKGSSTACIVALTDKVLHAINLGDSGFILVRDGCTIFQSPVQPHDFNFTYQLESGNGADLPSSGEVFSIPVASGDVIVAGTDGLFDNLYNSEIIAVVVHEISDGVEPQIGICHRQEEISSQLLNNCCDRD